MAMGPTWSSREPETLVIFRVVSLKHPAVGSGCYPHAVMDPDWPKVFPWTIGPIGNSARRHAWILPVDYWLCIQPHQHREYILKDGDGSNMIKYRFMVHRCEFHSLWCLGIFGASLFTPIHPSTQGFWPFLGPPPGLERSVTSEKNGWRVWTAGGLPGGWKTVDLLRPTHLALWRSEFFVPNKTWTSMFDLLRSFDVENSTVDDVDGCFYMFFLFKSELHFGMFVPPKNRRTDGWLAEKHVVGEVLWLGSGPRRVLSLSVAHFVSGPRGPEVSELWRAWWSEALRRGVISG